MTEKQIEKIKLSIKRHRATLVGEKRIYGGFDDSPGRRYFIADLYLKIADFDGALTYKKWFDKNFPDDIGSPVLSLNWSIAFHELGKINETIIYTIDTAFQNVYLHRLLLDKHIEQIDMYEQSNHDMIDFTKSIVKDCKKIVTKSYSDWLLKFIETPEYNEPVNRFIALNKLLKDERVSEIRSDLLFHIRELQTRIKTMKE